MKLAEQGELSLIRYIRNSFRNYNSDVLVGIGDDAAVLQLYDCQSDAAADKASRRQHDKHLTTKQTADEEIRESEKSAISTAQINAIGLKKLLISTDTMVEGVHFNLAFASLYQIGYKLVSINVSDIYAMYGTPAYLTLSLSAPGSVDSYDINRLFEGIAAALKQYNVSLIGGDITSSPSHIMLNAAIIGYADNPALRRGAKPKDKIYVSGALGDSACGLEVLKRINKPIAIENSETTNHPLNWTIIEPLLRRHLMPTVKPALIERQKITAMMDISDGLGSDLKKLCQESSVGAIIYEDKIPISNHTAEAAKALNLDPLKLSLCGGEDYELLVTSNEELPEMICIGEVVSDGITLVSKNNESKQWLDCGYEHFRV
ncbi:thiamine-monophosphate kinase [Candidatus Magnetoovum chiemensis]|nr:thiamine-monophosphate kinase [Candidatus Magnetoovum chiemensis]